jgi:hypothetical protein
MDGGGVEPSVTKLKNRKRYENPLRRLSVTEWMGVGGGGSELMERP